MLTVLSVAYPLARVGPDAVGGAEQVLGWLDRALVEAGHRSMVVACEGSEVAGELVATPAADGVLDDATRAEVQRRHAERIVEALERWPVDLVHMHGIDFHAYLPPAGVPVVATLHLPPDWYPPEVYGLERPDTLLHCVSASQRRRCPGGARLLPTIENGVDAEALRASVSRRGYALALGRICPEKGFHTALEAATLADVSLLLGGKVYRYEAHERYFRNEIEPRLDRRRRFLGPVGFHRKRRLLSGARCLLAPSTAPETSSLVAMEALACGTPVVARPSGALADIVEHGRTGFLVDDAREMAAAIEACGELSAEHCMEAARGRFAASRMVGEYLSMYLAVAGRGAQGAGAGSGEQGGERGGAAGSPPTSNIPPVPGRLHSDPGHPPPLRVDAIRTGAELEALRSEWADLWTRCTYATPFQRPEWLLPWWSRFGGNELLAFAVRRGDALVGLAPFFVYPDAGTGTRRVLPLGAGNTDYLGILVDPSAGAAGVEAVWAALDEQCDLWDVIDLKQLRGGAPELAARAPAGWSETNGVEPCPVLELRGADEAGIPAAVPAKFAKRLAYYERRIGREGEHAIERADAASLDDHLDALVRLHGARWEERGEDGVLAEDDVRAFHREAARGLLKCGVLRLYALRFDGRIVAAHYGLLGHGRAFYYIGGLDPQFDKLNPGTLVVGHAIRDAVRGGAAEFDFLRGQERYKYRWGARDRPARARCFRRGSSEE